ncbi:MAG: hypothetical protein HYZ74_07020 [Elusimicrobia bacterium]|nr:hypothetical protein [Elusimicrobiota bacterium]
MRNETFVAAALLLLTVGAVASPMDAVSSKLERDRQARAWVSGWPKAEGKTARAILEKYGAPAEVFADKLVWRDNGYWKTTIVHAHRDAGGSLQQSVTYDVPPGKDADLSAISASLKVSRAGKELLATGDSEEANFLAVNLADEVIRGIRSAGDAREFYRKTIDLASSGKSSPYMQGLLFIP